MAQSKIPNPLERRHLLERDLPAAQALALAESYLEEGRSLEAVAFLVLAEADERLAEIAELAVEAGDAFLLKSVADVRRVEVNTEAWSRLAVAAEAAGKETYATLARRQLQRGDE